VHTRTEFRYNPKNAVLRGYNRFSLPDGVKLPPNPSKSILGVFLSEK